MDSMILTGIGAAALAYIVYVVWRSASGKAACACDSRGSCAKSKGSCYCSGKS